MVRKRSRVGEVVDGLLGDADRTRPGVGVDRKRPDETPLKAALRYALSAAGTLQEIQEREEGGYDLDPETVSEEIYGAVEDLQTAANLAEKAADEKAEEMK